MSSSSKKISNNLAKKRTEPQWTRALRRLGAGSYGMVFQLTDDIAVKVGVGVFQESKMHKRILEKLGPACRQYFLHHYDVSDYPELKALGAEIAEQYGRGPMGKEYTFMEYLDPQEWISFRMLQSSTSKDSKAVQHITNNIWDALICLWKSGFRHRDLHKENILVHVKTGAIKIIDYGLTIKRKPIAEKIPRFTTAKQAYDWFKARNIRIDSNLRWTGNHYKSSGSSNSNSNRNSSSYHSRSSSRRRSSSRSGSPWYL